MKIGLTEVKKSQGEIKTGLKEEIEFVRNELTREMKEELQGISAAQDAMKEILQERLSIVKSRRDSFEEKVTLNQDKVNSVEAKILQIEKNFKGMFEKI